MDCRIDRQISIMGIVNLTDDSYFARSRCADEKTAVSRIETMLEEGADIIDLGACSTRPGASHIPEGQEWLRLEPVLKDVAVRFPGICLSLDTTSSSVVRKAYDIVGNLIVNDISAGEDDPLMLGTAGELGLKYVAMHKRGNPMNMQTLTEYENVVEDVHDYFAGFAERAESEGVSEWIIDPGFGFAKTEEQNYSLLRGLACFKSFGRPLLVGVSRKSMIYKKFSITPEDALPATQVLHHQALVNGADILRVHDVAEAVRTVALYRMLH